MGSIVAALIAVMGGSIAYAWQKSVDRREAQLRDKKEVYRDYLYALTNLQQKSVSSGIDPSLLGDANSAASDQSHAADALYLFADDAVAKSAIAVERSMLDWRRSITDGQKTGDQGSLREYFSARDSLIRTMRQDLFQEEPFEILTPSGLVTLMNNVKGRAFQSTNKADTE